MKKRPVHSRESLGGLAGMTPGFRNVGGVLFRRRGYAANEKEISVGYRVGREGLEAETLPEGVSGLALVSQQADRVALLVDGVRRTFEVSRHRVAGRDEPCVAIASPRGSVEQRTLPRVVDPSAQAPEGALVAPAAGSVTEVMVTVGQQVEQGASLAVVENVSEENAA